MELVSLQASFAANANNCAVCVGDDGSVLSTYISSADNNSNAYYASGCLDFSQNSISISNLTSGNSFDFCQNPPSVAIDQYGMIVSVHQSSMFNMIIVNVGKIKNGVGGFTNSYFGDIEVESSPTLAYGVNPSITNVGPGIFVVTAVSADMSSTGKSLCAYQLQIFPTINGGYALAWSPVSIVISSNSNLGSAIPAQSPMAAYYNNILCVVDCSNQVYAGSYDASTATFNVQISETVNNSLSTSSIPGSAVTVDPAGNFYVANAGTDSGGLYYTYLSKVIIENNNNVWSFNIESSDPIFGGAGNNYGMAIGIGCVNLLSNTYIIIAILDNNNNIDLFSAQSSSS